MRARAGSGFKVDSGHGKAIGPSARRLASLLRQMKDILNRILLKQAS